MSVNIDQVIGVTDVAERPIGARGYDRPPRLLEDRAASEFARPYQEALGEISLQLAARFADAPLANGNAPRDVREAGSRGRAVALVLASCLGISTVVAASSVYLLHRNFFHQYLFNGAPEPSFSLSTVSAPVLSETAIEPSPSAPAAYKDRSARLTTTPEPAPVMQAEPASVPLVPDDRPLNAEEVRELQTLLELLGLRPGRPDGIPGPLTAGAVKRYQESRGQVMSGSITRELLEQLRQGIAPSVSAADFVLTRAP